MDEHQRCRRYVAQHFAGRGSTSSERELRQHCASCVPCHAYYERHLLFSELDPLALDQRERLGRGLGLFSRAPYLHVARTLLLSAAAAACFVWLTPRVVDHAPAFQARGALEAPRAALQIYRIRSDGSSEAVPPVIAGKDELAFAYENPASYPFLSVFAVDEHGHVYWYHPEWSDAASDPVSVAVRGGPNIEELPVAVSHAIDGSSLQVVAVFARAPLHVSELEREVARLRRQGVTLVPALGQAFRDVVVVSRTLRVAP